METKGGGVFFSRFGWARSCRCPVENKTEEEGVGGKGKASSYWLPRFEWGAPTNRCASALETPYHPPVWEDKGKSFLELTKKIKKTSRPTTCRFLGASGVQQKKTNSVRPGWKWNWNQLFLHSFEGKKTHFLGCLMTYFCFRLKIFSFQFSGDGTSQPSKEQQNPVKPSKNKRHLPKLDQTR